VQKLKRKNGKLRNIGKQSGESMRSVTITKKQRYFLAIISGITRTVARIEGQGQAKYLAFITKVEASDYLMTA